MTGHILRRLGWTLVTAWFAVTVTFALLVTIPSDPGKALLGAHATAESIERVNAHYCLDQGFVGQYGCWLGHVASGDLGESFRTKQSVVAIIGERLWPTVQLTLAAIFLQLVIGVPLGIVAATRRGRWQDHGANMLGVVSQSAPAFFVATLLLYVFAYRFGWFPISGYGSGFVDRLHHLVLPATTLALVGIAFYARVTRSELIDVLGEDYIRTARAKGLTERTIVVRHALRHALGPLVMLVGLDLGVLVGGAVVVEVIFGWPGLGREVMQAVFALDLPLILGVVLLSAIAVSLANLLTDIAYLWIDPRLRDR